MQDFDAILKEIINKYDLCGSYKLDEKGFTWAAGAEEDFEEDAESFGVDVDSDEASVMFEGEGYRLRRWEFELFTKLDMILFKMTGIKSVLAEEEMR